MSNKKYGIVLDDAKCIDCKACTVACKMENNIPLGMYFYRNWVAEKPFRGEYRYTHVFVLFERGWRFVSAHTTPLS